MSRHYIAALRLVGFAYGATGRRGNPTVAITNFRPIEREAPVTPCVDPDHHRKPGASGDR
jgi:hypothetical protein